MPKRKSPEQLRAFFHRINHPETKFDIVARDVYENEIKRHSPARAAYIAEAKAGSISVSKHIYGGSSKFRKSGTIPVKK